MSVGLTITIEDAEVRGMLDSLYAGLREDVAELNESVGESVRDVVRDYLIELSNDPSRHRSATELGAEPSGFWGRAAKLTTFSASTGGATVSVESPGIGRVAHDVTITPGEGKQWLTIPLVAAAYNQRAYRTDNLFFVKPRGRDYALLGRRTGTGGDAAVQWFYLLVKSVYQTQDRTLLPSDEKLTRTAVKAVKRYVDHLANLQKGGAR